MVFQRYPRHRVGNFVVVSLLANEVNTHCVEFYFVSSFTTWDFAGMLSLTSNRLRGQRPAFTSEDLATNEGLDRSGSLHW